MARRATALAGQRTANTNLLVLDAGNTLFGQQVADESQGRVPVAAMNLMGYTAMTLGQADLLAGPAVLRQRAAEASFPFLGANLPADLPAKPFAIVVFDGREVAILGLTSADPPTVPASGGAVAIGDPIQTARQYVPELRKRGAFVIVLSNLGIDMDRTLAREVPGITAIIGGRDREFLEQPAREGAVVIAQAGFNGEALGLLKLVIEPNGVASSVGGEMLYLGSEFADDPTVRALVGEPVLQPGF